MRIAFLSYCFPEYCIRHVNEMASQHEVLLMLPQNRIDGANALIDSRVRYEGFYGPRYRQPFSQLLTTTKIIRTLRKFQPDVIHYQNGYLFFNPALPLLRKFPIVITIHDPRQHLGDRESLITPQWIMDFGFRRADHVIVHGGELVDTVEREIGIPKSRIHSIPHIAIGERSEAPIDEETGPSILFFGRIWEYKGLEYLIQAEPLVTREFPDIKFVIGGKGEDFERYQKMMVHLDRFEVHNEWISDEARASLFAQSSIVVLPYIEASQSGVIPIAYTHGKPVIATTVGGLPDMVEHGNTGLLVPPRDAAALAEAIIKLLRDSDLRKRMGLAGREKLKRECDPTVVVEQTLEVYQQAISDHQGTRRVKNRPQDFTKTNAGSNLELTDQESCKEVSA